MAEISEHRIDTGRIVLSVRERQGGEPTLLALHGLASNARWWDLVGARLAPGIGVVAVDLRGHGLSDRPADGYDFESVTADLRALCDRLGLDDIVVAGHSWGASVALSLAAAERDRCRGCICIDGGAGNLRAFFGDSWEVAAVRMRPPQLSGISEAMVRGWVRNGPLGAEDADAAEEIMLGNFESDGAGGVRPRLDIDRHMQIASHLFHSDSDALMRASHCPVLLIPAGDPEDPPQSRAEGVASALGALGDRGSVVWVDGVHDLPVQRPREVADAIRDFVTSLPPAG